METLKAIRQPANVQAPAASPQTAEHSLPWLLDDTVPPAVSSEAACRSSVAVKRSQLRPEAVHWSIVVLTVVTAISVLIGSHAGKPSRPRELLPEVIIERAH